VRARVRLHLGVPLTRSLGTGDRRAARRAHVITYACTLGCAPGVRVWRRRFLRLRHGACHLTTRFVSTRATRTCTVFHLKPYLFSPSVVRPCSVLRVRIVISLSLTRTPLHRTTGRDDQCVPVPISQRPRSPRTPHAARADPRHYPLNADAAEPTRRRRDGRREPPCSTWQTVDETLWSVCTASA
jgi:hypothetical protein